MLHDAGIDAEPIPELDFDQALGHWTRAAEMANTAERGRVWCRRRPGVLCGGVRALEFPICQYGDFPCAFRLLNQKDGLAPVLFS